MKVASTRKTVTINLLTAEDQDRLCHSMESRHNGRSFSELIAKAVTKKFGRSAFFHQDASFSQYGYYGQIFKRINRGGGFQATALTGKIRVDIR